ncbi:MAG TPA: 50S ribosomal protein L15 [Streptosporangiaceae bacterium]|nr:50S ribosomal protein L15 [Streptosporangiaceae bacterium]
MSTDKTEEKAAAESQGPGEPQAGRGLKLHHLRPAPGAHKAKTRVGRGEASKGKTAGRGTKGTKARNTVRLGFEGGQMPLQRRVPKLKGFSNVGFGTTYQVVNTGRLAQLFPEGGDVTPENMVARGAARKGELIKVLGTGDLPVALRVTAHAFSATAVAKIEQAGGTVTALS